MLSFLMCIFFKISSNILEFTSFIHEAHGSKIKFKHRLIDKLIERCVEVEEWFNFNEDNEYVGHVELVIGRSWKRHSHLNIIYNSKVH